MKVIISIVTKLNCRSRQLVAPLERSESCEKKKNKRTFVSRTHARAGRSLGRYAQQFAFDSILQTVSRETYCPAASKKG
ncbi:hypothetical protein PUN28_006437 [Cardiocondyla obscurior]|uniref:Uncharacterized protein n=1 Tax=Cardiocondyla obscurior TaxID=286306 RepID=A0AAW2G8N2_9HYME